jgi:hypothetical protein
LPVGQSLKAAACLQVSHKSATILVFHNVELGNLPFKKRRWSLLDHRSRDSASG